MANQRVKKFEAKIAFRYIAPMKKYVASTKVGEMEYAETGISPAVAAAALLSRLITPMDLTPNGDLIEMVITGNPLPGSKPKPAEKGG